MVCGDSHTCTNGGLGALAFGVGSSEVAHVLATQTLWIRKPRTLGIEVSGKLGAHITAKDLALHIIGVFAGIALIIASLTVWPLWTIIGFPLVHVAPGLLGHRLFDRDAAVGDLRLTRTDYPLWWFLVANHLMAVRVLTLRW